MWFDTLLRHVRQAARSLGRSRSFSLAVVLMLATGIAGWTTMFCIMNGMILRPLPVQDQSRILIGWRSDFKRGERGLPLTEAQVDRFAVATKTLVRTATVSAAGATMMATKVGDAVVFAKGLVVGGGFFGLLRTAPILGRTLDPADDQAGAPPAVVIGYHLWQRQFGGSPDVLTQTMRSNGRHHRIVGVMPRGFDLPGGAEIWLPLVDAAPLGAPRASWPYLAVVGRLAPNVPTSAATAEFDAFLKQEEQSAPADLPNAAADVRSLADYVVGEIRPVVVLFTLASALLLLLACVNVANLLMVRGAARGHELAVQLALGAKRSRLLGQLLTESLLLAAAASALGVGLSVAAIRIFVHLAPTDLPRLGEVAFDAQALLGAIAAVLAALLVFGLGPALILSRSAFVASLRAGGDRETDSRRTRLTKRAVVVGQVALAQLILVGAGLLINSWVRLETVPLGFAPANLTMARLAMGFQYSDSAAYHRFLADALPRLAALPGVEQVSVGATPPIANAEWFGSYFEVDGQAGPALAGNPIATVDGIGSAFFETVGTRILKGRGFDPADLQSPVPLAIVNEAFARQMWPGRDPIGQRIRLLQGSQPGPWRTVVGLAADSRYYHLRMADPTIYYPYSQDDNSPFFLLIRSKGPVTAALLLGVLRQITSEVWIPQVVTLPQLLAGPLARPRLDTAVLTCFAVLALLMSAAGIYALGAAFVRQRRRELGIRLALGALPNQLLLLVLGEGLALSALGAAIGLVGGVALSRGLATTLFAIRPNDPVTLALVAVTILAIGGLASLLPAQRASAVDPAAALRLDG